MRKTVEERFWEKVDMRYKLSEAQMKEVVERYRRGEKQISLARYFKVQRHTIRGITRRGLK